MSNHQEQKRQRIGEEFKRQINFSYSLFFSMLFSLEFNMSFVVMNEFQYLGFDVTKLETCLDSIIVNSFDFFVNLFVLILAHCFQLPIQ